VLGLTAIGGPDFGISVRAAFSGELASECPVFVGEAGSMPSPPLGSAGAAAFAALLRLARRRDRRRRVFCRALVADAGEEKDLGAGSRRPGYARRSL